MRRAVTIVLLLTSFASTSALAQTSKGTRSRRAPVAAKPSPATRAGAERIVAQIKTLSNFLFVYGGVIKSIQSAEQTAKEGGVPHATLTLIKKNKDGVVESIRNLQDGLRRMELDFSEDPSLKTYYQHINKLSDDLGLAADAADASRFDDAGQQIVVVIGHLANALLPERP